jgi:hypothetical protein
MADKFNNQPITISLYAQWSMYYYLLYFALHLIKIKPEDFEKLFIFFGVIFIFFYLLQYFLYPKVILFKAQIKAERGTIRIFLAGMSYFIICYYYALQKFLESHQLKYSILLLASIIIIILIGSRTLLLTSAVTTMLNLILSKRIKSRLLIYFMSALGIILIFFTFQNIFQELVKTALHRDPISSENIRFRAVKYFMSNFFPNKLTYIFGNGASSVKSEYSHKLWMISSKYGYYLGDIGIIGEYVNYGLLFLFGVFGILYNSIKSKIQPQYAYIKYFYVFTLIGIVLGGGFDDSEFIVLVCITLYIYDVSKYYLKKESQQNTTG